MGECLNIREIIKRNIEILNCVYIDLFLENI